MDDNKRKNNNSRPTPNGAPGKKNNGNKRPDWFMYVIYAIIILTLGGVLLGGNGSGNIKEIGWSKLDQILRKGDQQKIVVVDKEYAEI